MLVISRRPGEAFTIGDDIEVIILDSDHRLVRVGIRAPRQVPILRKELREVAVQNATALAMPSADRLRDALTEVERAFIDRRATPA